MNRMSASTSRQTYLVNGRFLGRPVTGVERFARETLRALDQAIPHLMPRAELLVAVPPGQHKYRFIVDGQWADDPKCDARKPNPFGGENCTRIVE